MDRLCRGNDRQRIRETSDTGSLPALRNEKLWIGIQGIKGGGNWVERCWLRRLSLQRMVADCQLPDEK